MRRRLIVSASLLAIALGAAASTRSSSAAAPAEADSTADSLAEKNGITMPLLSGEQSSFVIVPPAKANDTTDHVDLLVATSVPLSAIGARRSVTWASSNPAVVRVSSSGGLSARARGYATITARSGTRAATLQACVTAEPLHELSNPEGIPGNTMTVTLTKTIADTGHAQAGYIMPLRATEPLDGTIVPNKCVHYVLSTGPLIPVLDPRVISISRHGVVTAPTAVREFYISASIGPKIPTLSQVQHSKLLPVSTRAGTL
jgi:hypothetical protein